MPDLFGPTPRKTGFLELPPRPRDWIAGAISGIEYEEINPGSWLDYIPSGEEQVGKYYDTYSCVSFSANNVLETQLSYLIENGLLGGGRYTHDENYQWLADNDYLGLDGRPNFSDRWLAIKSGTTQSGNYLVTVADTFRKIGPVPEVLVPSGYETAKTWQEYMTLPDTPSESELKSLGEEFLRRFTVAYEWLFTTYQGSPDPYPYEMIRKHLKQAPLQIALPVCSPWNTEEIIYPCGKYTAQHAVMLYSEVQFREIFDSYKPFGKRLSENYYIPYAFKLIIKPNQDVSMSDAAEKVLAERQGQPVLAVPSGRIALVKGRELQEAPKLSINASQDERAAHRAGLMALMLEIIKVNGSIPDAIYDEIPHRPF